jgi:hypothetical protein
MRQRVSSEHEQIIPGRALCSWGDKGAVLTYLFQFSKNAFGHHRYTRNTTAPHASPTFTATTSITDIHRNNMHSRIIHSQRPTASAPSPTMTSLFTVQKHQLYVSRRMISDQAQHLVSTVNDVNSLISSMNDLITTENKSILVKRILTLSSYGESSNAGPLYLNHLVNLDFFDLISANDQAGLLMEETTVGVKLIW